jgi:TRAP-type C4-dicarboxylate transport system substrate-binding protein
MAKYEELFEDFQKLFKEVISDAGLERFMTITVLANNKAKEIFKINKANELLKHRTGDDVIIVINQKIFEQLTEEQQKIVVEEAIAYISFDSENDKVVITKPDFMAHSGILRKYGFETIEVVRESIKSIYQAEKEAEDESEAIAG